MNSLWIFWRDLKIISRTILVNILLFLGLLAAAVLLLHSSGAYPRAGWLELLVDAFHLAVIERVVQPGDGALPMVLTLVMPLLSVVILGEGVLRVLSAFIARAEHREEWDRMMAKTMQNHLVICGVGELGRTLVQQMLTADPQASMVLIDPRPGIMADLGGQYPNVSHIQADMTNLEALKDANCTQARMIFLTSGSDTLNLEAAYKVLKLKKEAEIWVRLYRLELAELFEGEKRPNLHFFCPYQDAALALAAQLKKTAPIP